MPESNLQNSVATGSAKKVCMGCYRENIELIEIPAATRYFLDTHSLLDKQITHVCQHCLTEFEGFKESPANYLVQKKVELQEKRVRWVNRVSDLKQGYLSFRSKNYKEAKQLYLNYLKTIELCLGVSFLDINKYMFEKFGRSEELNPFTLTLWDMVIICDKEGKPPSEEMTKYATKFVELAKDSISKQTVIHSIKKYKREATNKKLFKQLLVDLGVGGGCFVASYAFSDAYAPEVMQLREFRDKVLLKSWWGRVLVYCYYEISPMLVFCFKLMRVPRSILKNIFIFLLKYLPHS